MKHIFLDFDRTLFDTEAFYRSLEFSYIEGIVAGITDADFSTFVYPDVLRFICNVQKEGYVCHLVTFGTRKIQECKVRLSGLEDYFDQKFYVEQGSKAFFIKRYLDSAVSCEKAIFIDDSIEHLATVRSIIPQIVPVRIARPGAKDSELVDSRFETIRNLLDSTLFL